MRVPIISLFAAFCGPWLSAVVVVTGLTPTTDHAADPGDGAPWENVVRVNGTGSGTYLGGGWVLTAEHVYDDNPNPYVQFQGVNYAADPAKSFGIANPTVIPGILPPFSDLTLFRLTTALALPDVAVAAPTEGASLTMIGYGGGKSWGRNTVGPTVLISVSGILNSSGFTAASNPATPGNGKGTVGDSGGAGLWFDSGASEWRLVGVMNSITTGSTLLINLGVYGAEIQTIIATEGSIPEPGMAGLLGLLGLVGLRRKRKFAKS